MAACNLPVDTSGSWMPESSQRDHTTEQACLPLLQKQREAPESIRAGGGRQWAVEAKLSRPRFGSGWLGFLLSALRPCYQKAILLSAFLLGLH